MKYFIVVVIIVVLVGTSFWAGYKTGEKADSKPTPSQAQQSVSPVAVAPASTTPPAPPLIDKRGSEGDGVVGNRPGNFAPDFRLKNLHGEDVSLRDYLGREAIKLVFTKSGELQFQASSRDMTLRDPDDIARHLYGVTSMPYTVNIDERGIIR